MFNQVNVKYDYLSQKFQILIPGYIKRIRTIQTNENSLISSIAYYITSNQKHIKLEQKYLFFDKSVIYSEQLDNRSPFDINIIFMRFV